MSNENENNKNEIAEFPPRNNELILQCATDIIYKAGFTTDDLLDMN